MHVAKPPFAHYAGSRQPGGVLLVAEAHGEDEARLGTPLCGYTGKELFKMLTEAWPDERPDLAARMIELMDGDAWLRYREEWMMALGVGLTNVFSFQPPANNIGFLCGSKKEMPSGYGYPPIAQGKYVRPEYLSEVTRLATEIQTVRPNLIVVLGNTACWAIMGSTKISMLRGAVSQSSILPEIKVLPTYHPSAVCRQWGLRPVVLADLMKAARERMFPEIRRPRREVLVQPTLDEVREWCARPMLAVACDIETKNRQIEMIGLARSRSDALVVPLVDMARPGRSYWADETEEMAVLDCIEGVLSNPNIKKIFQNGLFDLQYLLPLGLTIRNATEDTMLLSHAMYPEMRKGLGFLGSIHTSEPAWKLMRVKGGETVENKSDE